MDKTISSLVEAVSGIGDGATVTADADGLDEAPSPVAAVVVPLAGGYWSPGPEREPFRRIADALGAQAEGLMSPGLLDDAETRDALVAHAGVRAVLDRWERLDVALFGIGGRSWGAGSVGEARRAEGGVSGRSSSRSDHGCDGSDQHLALQGAPRCARDRCLCTDRRRRRSCDALTSAAIARRSTSAVGRRSAAVIAR